MQRGLVQRVSCLITVGKPVIGQPFDVCNL